VLKTGISGVSYDAHSVGLYIMAADLAFGVSFIGSALKCQ